MAASLPSFTRVLVLPDGARVDISTAQDASQHTKVAINDALVGSYRTLPRSLALVISAVGTPHEDSADHIPKSPLLEIAPPAHAQPGSPATISVADVWAILNVLHTLFHARETIPIVFAPALQNTPELTNYLLLSGLARRRHTTPGDYDALLQAQSEPELFLLRETFWQGAGTALGFHPRGGWLRGQTAFLASAPFPFVQSFTRTDLVIGAHPLRPPRPPPGEVFYRRYIPSVGQTLELAYFDLTGDAVGKDADGVSLHLAAFHRWHNSDHVNRGWGERGPLDKHRKYITGLLADPGVWPIIMSWDGELMGYAEAVYLKENHAGPYIPGGAWDYDRGMHVLVGEQKFRGQHRSRAWFSSLHHFLFLADPRTVRGIGEPKASNPGMISLSAAIGMNVNMWFDFPYKRSAMTWLPRERWFKLDAFAFADDGDVPPATKPAPNL